MKHRIANMSVLLVLCIGIMSGCYQKLQDTEYEVRKLSINNETFYVEIADDYEKRVRGLQGRQTLLDNWGMLFVFPEERELAFWMSETIIPLDIAYIDANGIMQEIHEGLPNNRAVIRSQSPMKYALEMNNGWFFQHNISEGDIVRNIEKVISE